MNRAWTSRPTPTLDKFGIDLHRSRARSAPVGFLVGHAEEYERLVERSCATGRIRTHARRRGGIGKETIVQHLAFCLTKDDAPKSLFDKRLVRLSYRISSPARRRRTDARLKRSWMRSTWRGNIIIYIPDIHNLVRTSGTAYLSAADALMPIIMNNPFRSWAPRIPRNSSSCRAAERFCGSIRVIRVNEISEADAEKLLTYESFFLERQSAHLTMSFGAVKRAVSLAKKYFHDEILAFERGGAFEERGRGGGKSRRKAVTPDRVTAVAEEKVHIPMHEAGGAEAEKLLNMEDDHPRTSRRPG
jgi:ATP-dependent Clp protease ATP-binding subunit ClpA